MTASFPPIAPDARVVIVGGGVAALEATLALRALGADRLELVIVSADPVFRYRPLSVLTPFDHDPAPEVPLSALAASEGAELIVGEVSAVDTDARIVRTAPGGVIPYDVLIACLGAAPIMAVPGAVTFGGPRDIPAIQELLAEIDAGSANSIAFAYGGGPAGIQAIAAAVGEERGTLEDLYEPYLLQQGFLQRTPRGRVATVTAYRHFGLAQPRGAATPELWDPSHP